MHIVVIGFGMVGARFAEDVLTAAPEAQLTIVGAENTAPYNRVLLSDVVAGRTGLHQIELPSMIDRSRARIVTGAIAVGIHRPTRTVLLDDGELLTYDQLVLATGADARIPHLQGLPIGRLPAGMHGLRDLSDARAILAATQAGGQAVVLGGGVLGLEVAVGLRARGLDVTLVHPGSGLMDRQLRSAASESLGARVRDHGIEVVLGARATGVRTHGGRISALVLADGQVIDTPLLIVSAGTEPRVEIAADAGLTCRRGIVVDGSLTTSDPFISAIGDCAEPPEGSAGLIAQGWDQARRLADRLAGRTPSGAAAADDVVKPKAPGLEAVTFGDPRSPGRRLVLSDPDARRHVEVVVHQGRVVAGTVIGSGRVAADLVSSYSRATPVPADPAFLLLPALASMPSSTPQSPALIPDQATICRCNGVAKGEIVGCWKAGARTRADVASATRASTGCGTCADTLQGIIEWLNAADPDSAEESSVEESSTEHAA